MHYLLSHSFELNLKDKKAVLALSISFVKFIRTPFSQIISGHWFLCQFGSGSFAYPFVLSPIKMIKIRLKCFLRHFFTLFIPRDV